MQNIKIPVLMHLDMGWGWKVGIRPMKKWQAFLGRKLLIKHTNTVAWQYVSLANITYP